MFKAVLVYRPTGSAAAEFELFIHYTYGELALFSGAWVLRAAVSVAAELRAVHPLQVAWPSHLPQTQKNHDQGECILILRLKL